MIAFVFQSALWHAHGGNRRYISIETSTAMSSFDRESVENTWFQPKIGYHKVYKCGIKASKHKNILLSIKKTGT